MTASCKFLLYPLLITTACLASSIFDSDGDINRQSRQFLGPPLHYANFPVPIAVPRVSLLNQPNQRHYGVDGPTYVGVFPVLTGQQACPACPNATVCPDAPACPPAPVCKNCTVCETCPVVPVVAPPIITKCAEFQTDLFSSAHRSSSLHRHQMAPSRSTLPLPLPVMIASSRYWPTTQIRKYP